MEEMLKTLRDMADDLEHINEMAVGSLGDMGTDMAQALRDIADDLEQNVVEEDDEEEEPEAPSVRQGRRYSVN
jgi:hypothetical protein